MQRLPHEAPFLQREALDGLPDMNAGVTARICRLHKFSGRKTSSSRSFVFLGKVLLALASFPAQWNFSWAYSGNIPPVDTFRAGYFSQKIVSIVNQVVAYHMD